MNDNDIKTSFFIARKTIARGRKSTLALMVSVLALLFINMMFISGVLSGLWQTEVDLVISLLTSDITISPQRDPEIKQFIQNQNELRAQLETIPGVIATARHYQIAGSISFDKDKSGQFKSVSGAIIGIDPSDEKKVFTLDTHMLAGEPLTDGDTDKIMLSSALAGGFGTPSTSDLGGVKVDDKVQITYQNGIMRTYTVKGIYNDLIGIYETFITSKEAESVLGVYDNASQIMVSTDLTRNTIQNYEAKVKMMAPNLTVKSFNDLLGSVASFQDALSFISNVVSVISVIVAAITIFVLIYVNAVSRKRQIGILKAIGIKQEIIVNAYILQSLFYTVFGLFIGVIAVFGILQPLFIAYPVAIIEDFMYITLTYTALGIVIAITAFVIAGYLSGRIPARIVAKQNILTAIWG